MLRLEKKISLLKCYFLTDVDIGKVLFSKNIFSGEKTISTLLALLVTCIMIIKLKDYI